MFVEQSEKAIVKLSVAKTSFGKFHGRYDRRAGSLPTSLHQEDGKEEQGNEDHDDDAADHEDDAPAALFCYMNHSLRRGAQGAAGSLSRVQVHHRANICRDAFPRHSRAANHDACGMRLGQQRSFGRLRAE